MIYIDSSVVLSRFLEEARTPPDVFWDAPLASGKLLEYEVLNRIYAHERGDPEITDAKNLLKRMLLVELSGPALKPGLGAVPTECPDPGWAPLATIEYLRRSGETIELASYDNRMIAAAQALGVEVTPP